MSSMSAARDPKASTTLLAGLIGMILILAVGIFAVVMFLSVQGYEEQRKLYEPKYQALIDAQTAQRKQIDEYRIVDAEGGIVAIPIDVAIPRYVERLKSGTDATTIEQSGPTDTAPEQPETSK
jgi:hypothetical protein